MITPTRGPTLKQRQLEALARRCERCGSTTEAVTQQPCRTAYTDEASNVSPWLCAPCAEAYHDYWDSAWADYYNGSGIVYVTPEMLKQSRIITP